MEQWEKWIPSIGRIPAVLYNDCLIDDDNGLTIKFSDEDKKVSIVVNFEGLVLSYRNRDEGSFLKKIKYLDENYPSDFYVSWSFFLVSNSSYISWFIKECEGIYTKGEIYHLVFITPNDVIEVLSTYLPRVKIERN